jgi:hypothetical protein
MKLKEWLDEWSMTSLKVNLKFLEMEWNPNDTDKDAAWEMYIELITRVATQDLLPEEGDEETALTSAYQLFDITREVIKRKGRHCESFTKIAIIILNQKIRPFTAKWHKVSVAGKFKNAKVCKDFRDELGELQDVLRIYSQMLADMAGVEDLTELEG